MHERVLNFLENWIDANIVHPGEAVDGGIETLKPHFLTDAVAAGLTLDEVNEEWAAVEAAIRAALGDATSNALGAANAPS